MFPGLGGLNPKKMQGLMKQMGISQEEIEAVRVVINKPDGSRIIVEPASVTKVNMQGQDSFQVAGEVREEAEKVDISQEDILTVVERTGKSEEEAKTALEETGDLAEAIMKLSE